MQIFSPSVQKNVEQEMARVSEVVRAKQGEVVVVHSYNRHNVHSGCMGSQADYYHEVEAGIIDGDAFSFDTSENNILGLPRYFSGIPLVIPVRNRSVVGDVYGNTQKLSSFYLPIIRLDHMRKVTEDDEGIRLGRFFYRDGQSGCCLSYYVGDEEVMERFKPLINGSKRPREDFIAHIKQG